jgi:hypothetical protein
VPLAIGTYDRLKTLADGSDLLNLAWTLDEAACLDADLPGLPAAELAEGLPT